jgi:hypothetical protein
MSPAEARYRPKMWKIEPDMTWAATSVAGRLQRASAQNTQKQVIVPTFSVTTSATFLLKRA